VAGDLVLEKCKEVLFIELGWLGDADGVGDIEVFADFSCAG